MKDAQLIELLKTRNYTKASEKLYAYFPVIKKLVLKNNGSLQDAEDVFQEALIILFRKVQSPGFTLSSSLNTYLYSVCRFLWNDELKKKGKRLQTGSENELADPMTDDLRQTVQLEKQYRLAEKALAMIGERCRELLLLFYFRKQSLKEIAVAFRFGSERTAKNQKYRCLEKAKENLKTLKTNSHE